MLSNRQIGKFIIPFKYIISHPQGVMDILKEELGDMLVVSATFHYDRMSIEYIAICSAFKEVESGLEAPFYDLMPYFLERQKMKVTEQ